MCTLQACAACSTSHRYPLSTYCFACIVTLEGYVNGHPKHIVQPLGLQQLQAAIPMNTLLSIQSAACPHALCMRRWAEVWARLRELQAAAFPGLPRSAMLAELVRAQLRCGNWRGARLHLAGRGASPLAPEDAEALVVAAGREYFYAASSLDAPEIAQVRIAGSQGM